MAVARGSVNTAAPRVGAHAAVSKRPIATTMPGMTTESCRMALIREMKKGARKNVNAIHPEHMMYVVANSVLEERLLR
jgi:hypothetical protein